MFPCKTGFNTEGSELTVGHWTFGIFRSWS